ncbi:MAG: phospho-sugar mutase [Planctomycetota bacterium]
MDEGLRARVRAWIEQDPDPTTQAELEALLASGDEAELRERFAGPLEFGTAGLRGLLGAGETRMNRAVVIRTSHGLGQALLARDPGYAARGVVIGYDGRILSRELARDTAEVLAAQGFRVLLSEDLCPTPLLAYALTHFGAAAGVMVTASHNPPEYNGYKVYADNGAQIVPPWDEEIAAAIAAAPGAKGVPRLELEAALAAGQVETFGEAIDEAYLQGVLALASPDRSGRAELPIVYTPLHGVGKKLLVQALARAGFAKVDVVAAQAEPDGAFPTVRFPNPEEKGALDLALALARERGAALIIANDPDADRLACVVRAASGDYVPLTGNEVGVLLGSYLLRRPPTPGLPLDGEGPRLVMASIVSSPQLGAYAELHGVEYGETLTGFKWIANDALTALRERDAQFVFGYEEALGYTVGTLVRDKDGIGAALVLCELAAKLAGEGRTLLDELEALARETGLFVSGQRSTTFPGQEGQQVMREIMTRLRQDPPREIGGVSVLAMRDYVGGERLVLASGARERLSLPASDVMVFELATLDRIIARPSGTEPKIKFYFDVREPIAAGEPLAAARERAQARLVRLQDAFVALAQG